MASTIIPEPPSEVAESAPVDMTSASSDSMDYHKYPFTHPNYRAIKASAPSATDPLTIGASARSSDHSISGPMVYNPSYTEARGDFRLEGTAPVATPILWMHEQIMPWSKVAATLATTSSVLMDLNYADNYVNMVTPYTIDKKEFETSDRSSRFSPMRIPDNGTNDLQGTIPPLELSRPASVARIASKLMGTEAVYCRGWDTRVIVNPLHKFVGRFKLYKDSIFGVDKDLPLNEPLKISLEWGVASKYFWWGVDINDPTAGATAFVPSDTLYISVSKFELIVYKQMDEILAAHANRVAASGLFKLPIPYVTGHRSNIATRTDHSIERIFNKTQGLSVLRIYTSAYHPTETSINAFNRQNIDGDKITSFRTYVGTSSLQENDVLCGTPTGSLTIAPTYDDWRLMKDLLRDTIMQSRDQYQYNWLWLEDFAGVYREKHLKVPKENIVAGLALGAIGQSYVFAAVTPAATYNWHQYVVFQRFLEFKPMSPTTYVSSVVVS